MSMFCVVRGGVYFCDPCYSNLPFRTPQNEMPDLGVRGSEVNLITPGSGLKQDDGKLPLDLLPMRALQEVAKVLAFGVKKYDRNSWQGVKPRRRYFAAMMRHLFDRALGKKIDEESGLPTMAHAVCDGLFLLAFDVGLDPIDAFDEEK